MMATKMGSGSAAAGGGTIASAIAATRQALDALAGNKPLVGLIFASPAHPLDVAIAAARSVCVGTAFFGCSTAGELTERGLTHGAIAVMLIASEELVIDLELVTRISAGSDAAARQLCDRFADTVASARKRGLLESTTITLIDGLSGVGEKLVAQIIKRTRTYQQVVGGAAGDEGCFKQTVVGAGNTAATDSAVALHVFGRAQWGVGVDHGLQPSTPKMVVTRARGNVVYEIDNRPAFEVYQKYAHERGVALTRDNAKTFMINHELGVYFINHLQRARAPLAVGMDGSITCAADIEEGSSISILSGEPNELVLAARNAAREARESLRGVPAAGVLLFDCICRGTILDREFGREIAAVRDVFPGVPICGFLTYGEIARYKGRLDGWHNSTAVVTAIPARA